MAGVTFGFWDSVGEGAMRGNVAEALEGRIALARRVEELGYESYFVIEHQNAPQGKITAPTVYLTAVARATERLRIGAMMWQLPFYHPIRLAQEVAMLDQLSHGRVEFGTGIGVHEHEFIRWGVDFYQRAAISEEVLKVVKMAWTQDEVTYEGKYFRFDEALPFPKPFQQPHPPIWAAVHSEAAVTFAAQNNYNVAQNLDTDEVVARKFELFWKVWSSCGHPAGPRPRVFLQRYVHVAETDELAHEEARQHQLTGQSAVFGGGSLAKTRIGWGTNPRGMGRDSDRPADVERGRTTAEAGRNYEFAVENGLLVVGSPETVARRIASGAEQIGYTLFVTNHQLGEMPPDLVQKSVELFGREVMPAFR